MARKTTKAAEQMIEQYDNFLEYYNGLIKNVELEGSGVASTNRKMELLGIITGMKIMTETFLHQQNCYHGYYYIDDSGKFFDKGDYRYITDHPDFRNYRVRFNIKRQYNTTNKMPLVGLNIRTYQGHRYIV